MTDNLKNNYNIDIENELLLPRRKQNNEIIINSSPNFYLK